MFATTFSIDLKDILAFATLLAVLIGAVWGLAKLLSKIKLRISDVNGAVKEVKAELKVSMSAKNAELVAVNNELKDLKEAFRNLLQDQRKMEKQLAAMSITIENQEREKHKKDLKEITGEFLGISEKERDKI